MTKPNNSKSTKEQELREKITNILATYLDGLHNPNDQQLYNELRAKRDTDNLKDNFIALITSSNAEAYERGRIDEAKICYDTKRHDSKGEAEAYNKGCSDTMASPMLTDIRAEAYRQGQIAEATNLFHTTPGYIAERSQIDKGVNQAIKAMRGFIEQRLAELADKGEHDQN